MTFTLDLGFQKGEDNRFGGANGGLRMTGENADDVIDSLCEKMNRAIAIISENDEACRVCAVIDPDEALAHTTEDHKDE